MEIMTAKLSELTEILKIYAAAREFMRSCGNPTQWEGGYPQRELLEQDIAENTLFVLKEGENILAVFKFFVGADPDYGVIYQGEWLNDRPYGVIHRIAAAKTGAGYAARCIEWCKGHGVDVRADTHTDNQPMKRLLEKSGFRRCGEVVIRHAGRRIAYHWVNSEGDR